ncbi:hypothetical protein ACFLRU_06695 [Bacteroidota bacterium]
MQHRAGIIKTVAWVLRIVISLTFIGHGTFAILGNVHWLTYLNTVGFSIEMAKEVIVIIGVLDIIVAIMMLIKPYKYVVLWAFIWAFATALIRPISGESILAFIERGANWGAPLALYLLLYFRKNA